MDFDAMTQPPYQLLDTGLIVYNQKVSSLRTNEKRPRFGIKHSDLAAGKEYSDVG